MDTFFLILFITIVNIGLWIIFLIRFKNLFTYEEKLEKAEKRIDNDITQMNKQALHDINLINDHIALLKQACLDAQRQIDLVHREIESKEKVDNFSKRVESVVMDSRQNSSDNNPAQVTARRTMNRSQIENSLSSARSSSRNSQKRTSAKTFDPGNAAYEVLLDGMPSLFDDIPTSGGEVNLRKDGSSYASVPVLEPSVFMAENTVRQDSPQQDNEDNFANQVRALALTGKSSEDIAVILGCSLLEVDFVLNL